MNRQDISAQLEAYGISATQQRVEIAAVLLTQHQHLSADQVLARVNQAGGAVSKATVYNTLGLLVEKGLIRQVIIDPNRVFYDSNHHAHHHFYNVDDGSLTDFEVKNFTISGMPDLPPGTVADGVDVVVRVRNRGGARSSRSNLKLALAGANQLDCAP